MIRYFKITASQKRPVRFLLSRLLVKLGLNKTMTIQRQGYKIRFHGAALAMNIWVNRMEKQGEEDFLKGFIKPGDAVIDVGANIGNIALALSTAAGKNGKVIAFEPHPETFHCLSANIALNGFENVEAHNLALGQESGTLPFTSLSDDSQNRVAHEGKPAVFVPIKRLDDIETPERIRLIKIDVEGFEPEVLMGATQTLKKTDIVYLECIPAFLESYDHSEEGLCNLLEQSGFKVFEVLAEGFQDNVIGSRKKKMLLCFSESYMAQNADITTARAA